MLDLCIQGTASTTRVTVQVDVLGRIGEIIRDLQRHTFGPHAVVISDHNVQPLYGPTVIRSLEAAGFRTLIHTIAPGEESKSLLRADDIYRFLAKYRVARDAVIVAVGGGVVSDLAGFAAATWMRGVRFVICPTTLEADVDACLGGKTALNVPGAKNLVGSFHQPILVAVDPTCLHTLEQRDVHAGLAESIKHALISSVEFVAWHEVNVSKILALDDSLVAELIERNLRIKGAIVEQDPYEQTGVRMCLNFGHTIGHAIEECCSFALRHGECVALGMLAACRLSHEVGLLDLPTVTRAESLLQAFGLPTRLSTPIDIEQILATIRGDKKVRGGVQTFVLLEGIGRPTLRDDIREELVRAACGSLLP